MTTTSTNSKPRLRVCLLVNSITQPKWVFDIIKDIQSSSIAEICLVIKNETTIESQTRFRSYWRNRQYLLYALYNRVDGRARTETDPFEEMDLQELLTDVSVLGVLPVMKKFSDWFPEEVLDKIRAYDLDVALSFGFRILRGEALRIARHGVWSYHHGDNLVNRGGPAGFWEVMEGNTVTGSVLQVLTEDLDNGKVIYRSWSPTSDKFSVKANRRNLYWNSITFVGRALRELHETGTVGSREAELYRPYSGPLYKTPTNSEMLQKLLQLSARYIGSKIRNSVSQEQWALAYKFKSSPNDANNSLYRFTHVIPPKDRFWADPFPIRVNGKYYVFFEELVFKTNIGHVMVMELDKNGAGEPTLAMKTDYHLSYPFVFYWKDQLFMIPETAANRTVELYVCESFPSVWKQKAVLFDNIKAKDATLFERQGRWWMFVTISNASVSDELFIYHAQTPLGPWEPHKKNPVKSDVRNSRPAGRLFTWNGSLYRPAQDSSRHYGYAVTINKVLHLDEEDFIEMEVSKVLPRWRKDVLGVHTFNVCDDLTIVDCLLRRRR